MSIIALREKKAWMTDEFINSLLELKNTLTDHSTTIRELKAIYFTINLDYIRICEKMNNGRYFSSRNCDIQLRKYNSETEFNAVLQLVNQRINEIIQSLS